MQRCVVLFFVSLSVNGKHDAAVAFGRCYVTILNFGPKGPKSVFLYFMSFLFIKIIRGFFLLH